MVTGVGALQPVAAHGVKCDRQQRCPRHPQGSPRPPTWPGSGARTHRRGRHAAGASPRSRTNEPDRPLRTLVADPATDFATLDADEFFSALRCACQESTVNPALIADVERRVAEGTATSRDLHQVLFIAGDDVAWQHSRTAAMAAVARQPHLAVEVVQLGGPAPWRATATRDRVGRSGRLHRARVARPRRCHRRGQACFDTSKKRASQRALVSLLGELTGIPVDAAMGLPLPAGSEPTRAQGPGEDTPSAPHRRSAPVSRNGGESPSMAAPATSPGGPGGLARPHGRRPEPDPELAAHLAAGRLTPRSLYLLLFEADPAGWRQHRAQAWSALVATPSQAPGVLSMCTQARCWPPAGCMELGEGTAVAYVTTPEGRSSASPP